MAVEREYRAAAGAPPSNVCFDRTSSMVIFPSLTGIKARRTPSVRTAPHPPASHPPPAPHACPLMR
eukprot:2237025-Prymnesium_polylepis.1